MSVYNVLNTSIYSKLTSGTALTNLLAGTTSIYYQQAPDEATLPFVVFSHQAGGPENTNPSDMRRQIVYVRAYASTPALAGSIDAQISTLLHRGALSITGYTAMSSWREEEFTLLENLPSGERIYTAGAFYRIQLDS